jgi:hypothetical protein
MKKTTATIIVAIAALFAVSAMAHGVDSHFFFDGDEIDGPFGALVALLAAGGGILIAGMVIGMVGLLLAVVFAGLGVLAVGVLCVAGLVLALVLSPALLLVLPVALIWWLATRHRRADRIVKSA